MRRLRGPRGQAMVEYSVVSHAILLGGAMAMLPAVTAVLNAITKFYDSVYVILQTAAL
jgi:Flp pilus assembly pilin Flp